MKSTGCFLRAIVVFATLVAAGSSQSRTWRVNADETGDAPTIQAAIDSSAAGDTITLASGSFTLNSNIQFHSKTTLVINSDAGQAPTDLILGEWFLACDGCAGISFDSISFRNGLGRVLSFYMSSDVRISNCVFLQNGLDYLKSAVLFQRCDGIDLRNNVFAGNYSGVFFYDTNSNIAIYGSTLLANVSVALELDGVLTCTITHSIVSGSSYGIVGSATGLSTECNDVCSNGVNYAILDFPDPTGLNGNISVDPQFCSVDPVAYNNYMLQSDSPCAPGNHPGGSQCGLIGCKEVGCGPDATEKTSWSRMKRLFK
jgi:hypothetical protein